MYLYEKRDGVFGPVHSLLSRLFCMLLPLALEIWFSMLCIGTCEMMAYIGEKLKIDFGKVVGVKEFWKK